jgi:glutamate---cysteine ligase / carboxylate-amine ligase
MQNDPVTRTVGVEEEFLLVQASSPALAPVGEVVVATAGRTSDGQFEHELKQAQVELGSSPQESMAVLERDLRQRRAELGAAAAAKGVRLIASATFPGSAAATATTPESRYERMTELFGRVARTQLTCGMHVHVAIESPEEGVGILDLIRDWLPVIRALTANSPFLGGLDTDYASYRSVLWGQWPSAGVADLFGSVEAYEQARSALVSSGAAMDDAMIYFDARLSARYPTVEVRVADVCADVADAAVVAALVRGLIATAAAEWQQGVAPSQTRSELLRAATWCAARWGMAGELVDLSSGRVVPAWDLLARLLDRITPVLADYGDVELVTQGLHQIRRRGTGARLQRAGYEAGGTAGVLDALAEATLS